MFDRAKNFVNDGVDKAKDAAKEVKQAIDEKSNIAN